jgi:hypothetical protein
MKNNTYFVTGGDGGDTFTGEAPLPGLLLPSLYSVGVAGADDATDASADNAGRWSDAWLPCRCCVYEATVDVEEGRGISWPNDGSGALSSSVDAILNAGRSKACSIDGLRNDSRACGRGRIEVARAEAVVY